MILTAISFSLPLADPILKFLIILLIILAAPLLLNRLRVPHLLGLIIAGAIIGPHGFNLVLRDSSIILSGTAGLLYIMFLAGLEIDMGDFKKNSGKSFVFGMFTFCIPMLIGTAVGYWILKFSIESSILLASMFASHTLIAYPIISRLGISKDPSVSITVGGTMITDVLALLVLAIIVGMVTGNADTAFWWRMGISIALVAIFILFLLPYICRWFFKMVKDSISQYIFVLSMVFFGAFLAQLAGMEGIIGSFLVGLSVNRLIPHTSPLMNRIEFVGNSIFIPFFLISVGMLINYEAFFTSFETIKVGVIMIIVATFAKYAAAWATQKTFELSIDQRRIIFGLSNAQAAATLAAVMVGYNVILGTTPEGEPIRLLSESVLNGTILMILVTCTMASFSTQKGAHNIAAEMLSEDNAPEAPQKQEHILIASENESAIEELVELSLALKDKKNKQLYAIKVIDNSGTNDNQQKAAERFLEKISHIAAGAGTTVKEILRYDLNISNAVTSVILENNISDIVISVQKEKAFPLSFFKGGGIEDVLHNSNVNVFISKSTQPHSTVKRHIAVIPEQAGKEIGFDEVIFKLCNVARNTGSKLVFYGNAETNQLIQELLVKQNAETAYHEFENWDDFLIIFREVKPDDNLWVMLSRKNGFSYNKNMQQIPGYLNKYLSENNFTLVYPAQASISESTRYLT